MAINETITVYGNDIDIPAKRSVEGKTSKSYGFNHPMGESTGGGYFPRSSGRKLILNNLRQLLGTGKGERVKMPTYGVSLQRFLFEPLDEITVGNIEREVRDAVSKWEGRVEVTNVRVYHLNDYTLEGLQAIAAIVTVRVKDTVDSQINVPVRIG